MKNTTNNLLEIIDLQVQVGNKIILNSFNLTIKSNELHAILGPNGNGKSTLLHTIMGNPKYIITNGDILFNGKSISDLEISERGKLGIFLGWQNPVEVPGLSNIDYLKLLSNSVSDKKLSTFEFYKMVDSKMKKLNLPHDFLERYFNTGFSGGEKKQNEILQLLVLNPKFIMLDEIDSGLDIDSLNLIKNILLNEFKKPLGGLIISHYLNFLHDLPITNVHILIHGRIVETGNQEIIEKVKKSGFNYFYKKHGITKENEQIFLQNCAVGSKFHHE